MARRIIATAEVQVAADVGQAEAGLNGLTESFRVIGARAEKAAERAEAAFFGSARSIEGGYNKIIDANDVLLTRMAATDNRAREMARSFRQVADAIQQSEETTLDEKAREMLRLFKEVAAATEAVDQGLHDAARTSARLVAEQEAIERAAREAAEAAQRLERAFRDVGREIDLVMAGGVEGLENDIRDVIRRLEDMGGEFRDVGRIGEAALDDIFTEFEGDAEAATRSLFRLEMQLRDVADIGDRALDGLDDDARRAAVAMRQLDRAAERTDNALSGMTRRVSGNVRGLIGLLGAAGLGMAAQNTARWGLDMTIQLEKAEAMFLGLTGSVEGAADMLERMVIFARETPYNLGQVTESAAQLLAVGDGFGVTTSNVEDFMTTFGEAITMTGGGDEVFTRLVRVFGQMSSSGKVLGQDMNQLAQSLPGYNVWEALAEGANTSVEELRRLQNIGQLDELLTGDEAVRILIDGMKEIPGAAGAMDRRMNTLGGAIEKFKETAQLAVSEGLEPFAETAQDALSDPVILNSVEDLANAFGALLSEGLAEVAPELDDLAAAGENVLVAMSEWAGVVGHVTDSLGDFLNFISPVIAALGELTDATLGAGDGLGKLAVAGGLMFAGPWGIAAGLILGISGAMDLLGAEQEKLANTTRILAAVQGEVNDAMSMGEEVVRSEARQLAIQQATDLAENFDSLAASMVMWGEANQGAAFTVGDLNTAIAEMVAGQRISNDAVREWMQGVNEFGDSGAKDDLLAYTNAWIATSDTIEGETQDLSRILVLAGDEASAALEAEMAEREAYNEALAAHWKARGQMESEAADAAAGEASKWAELDEERTDALKGILADQVSAYEDWEAGINDSTSGAALSLASVAEEAENSAADMIAAINENSVAVAQWKGNIVTAASQLVDTWNVPDEAAQEFMGTLGEMGIEAAPALQQLVDDANNGGTQLKEFFDAVSTNAAVMESDLTTAFDDATGSVPSLAESLSEGTLTIEEVLAALPAAMEAAGMDMEAAAEAVDMSDEMGIVGQRAVDGLVNALNSGTALARVRSAANTLANQVVTGTQVPLRVQSPSRVMYEIGEFAVEGLIGGMQSLSDEAYAVAANVATMMTGGIADHFRDAEDPQDEARKFAEDVASSIIDELIAEQEAVADAAEALAEAAADRLSEAWDRVKDRFRSRDMREAVSEAKAELAEAQVELATAQRLSGASGRNAIATAEARVAKAEAAVASLRQQDASADLAADQAITDLRRRQEDQADALVSAQEAEIAAINQRITSATRNLDPVARAAAEADLAAAETRHEAERTAFDRRQEDEANAFRRRLDNEDKLRDAAIQAKEDELNAFGKALDDIVKSVADAIKNLPNLRADLTSAERDVQEAFLDQFEATLENLTRSGATAATSLGIRGGLSENEARELVNAAIAAQEARSRADSASAGVGNLLNVLSSGLYTIGSGGALGIASGIDSQAAAIARAMIGSVQAAVNASLAALEIRSPSRVTARMIGAPMAQGIAEGLTATIPEVGSAMTGLLDNVIRGVAIPPSSQLVGGMRDGPSTTTTGFNGPLVSMPGAIIQDATDADLVAQRVVVSLQATGLV